MSELIVKEFDSSLDFLEWASNAPCLWKYYSDSRKISSNQTEWTGTKNYEEAYELAKYGWPQGLQMLSEQVKIAERMQPPATVRRRRHDIAGHYPNPARAAAGEIFSMVQRGRVFSPKPIIRIRYNYSALGGVNPDTIMKFGAALCSYINRLEIAGHPVELEATNESRPSDRAYESEAPKGLCFRFPLKKAGQPLSLSNVVFWWAHPSAQRRITFSARERIDIERWYGDGYGRTDNVLPIEPGVLNLSINDAGKSIEQNLETILKKHSAVVEANPSVGFSSASLQKLNL
jgi:hypothetical protein